jgi:hypothetical protein
MRMCKEGLRDRPKQKKNRQGLCKCKCQKIDPKEK